MGRFCCGLRQWYGWRNAGRRSAQLSILAWRARSSADRFYTFGSLIQNGHSKILLHSIAGLYPERGGHGSINAFIAPIAFAQSLTASLRGTNQWHLQWATLIQ